MFVAAHVHSPPQSQPHEVLTVHINVVAQTGQTYAHKHIFGFRQQPQFECLFARLKYRLGAANACEIATTFEYFRVVNVIVVYVGTILVYFHPEYGAVRVELPLGLVYIILVAFFIILALLRYKLNLYTSFCVNEFVHGHLIVRQRDK